MKHNFNHHENREIVINPLSCQDTSKINTEKIAKSNQKRRNRLRLLKTKMMKTRSPKYGDKTDQRLGNAATILALIFFFGLLV